jgi:SagB-type dehydrogenase family enzyme
MGAEAHAAAIFDDDELARDCGLVDEWPMLIVRFEGESIPRGHSEAPPQWFGGTPNRLSASQTPYPLIDEIHAATKRLAQGPAAPRVDTPPAATGDIPLRPTAASDQPFGIVARRRRSALDFRGGAQTVSFEQLSTLLDVSMRPFRADFGGLVHLYLYVHRVDGLAPGVYRHWPDDSSLHLIRGGDQRLMSAALSLGQDLAGNACVAFSMIADLKRAARTYGNRGYRYAHFEAGAVGHRLYVAAEAMGFQCTGIGAFFDDEVHRYLEITPEQGQVVYHFAAGFAVPDDRLTG